MEDGEKITKGVNAGYLLAKYNPELSKKLLKSMADNKNDLAIGFLKGAKLHKNELSKRTTKERIYLKQRLKNSKSKPKNKDLGRD